LQKARALWVANRFDESLRLFDEAVRRAPQNLLALIDAARAFGARFEITRAEELLDQLIRLAGPRAELWHLAGQSYRMIFRPDKAFTCFRRALHLSRDLPDTLLELALLHERRHQLDEAASMVEACLRAEPGYAAGRLVQARLLRRQGNEAGAEAQLRDLAGSDQNHPLVQAQAWAELAHMLDRRNEFDAAMSAMLRSKELLLREEGPVRRESDAVVGHLRTLADSITPAHFRAWREAEPATPHEQVAALCSFPRSGTTLLEQILDAHPGLVSSDEREAFARDIFPAMWQTPATPLPEAAVLDAIPRDRLAAQRRRYLAYMEAALNEPRGGRVHLDKNPSLTLLIPALVRLFPEMKLVVAIRDPRDVVLSCFMQYLPLNTNSVCFLSLERTIARYVIDMTVWLRFREMLPGAWVEIRYEDTVADLEGQARRALEFLGLPWNPAVLAYRERLRTKPVNSPTYEAVSQPLYTRAIGRWRNYTKHFEPYLDRLQPLVEAFGYAENGPR
jgi:tetratricopeptide (TPR) repeat protein